MQRIVFFAGMLFLADMSSHAQQRIEPGMMNYIMGPKPNNILYRDTLYKGSAQFMELFYRTKDAELLRYYRKHQSNKVTGNILGVIGMVSTVVGIARVSSGGSDNGTAWLLAGGGFAATLTGGYLNFMAQRNLFTAVTLFNQRHNRAALGIGTSGNRAGLVLKF